MKSAEAVGKSNVVALPQRQRDALEFLPAALEIIETPASPVGRAVGAVVIAFFCGALAWASLGKVDIIATAEGRVIPVGKTKVIQPLEIGVVREIRVGDGTAVEAGDVLVELDPTSDQADAVRLRHDLEQDRLDVARLEALLKGRPDAFNMPAGMEPRAAERAREQTVAQAEEHAAKISGLDRQIGQKAAEMREATASIGKLESSLPLLREQRDIRHDLLTNQYGNKLMYLQIQQQVVEAEHGIEEQREHRVATGQALAALERQRDEMESQYRRGLLTDLAKAETQAAEHGGDIVKANRKSALRTLRAPVAGTVQQVAVHTIGGIVSPAQQLMVVVPRDAGLEIEATLGNKDAGFVHAGQTVAIKIETFNFTRYGLIDGTVLSVSRDATGEIDPATPGHSGRGEGNEPSRDEKDRQSRQAGYVARVSLSRTRIETEYGSTPIEPGMAVTAEIKTGQRRVIDYLLSPLTRVRQEAMRER